MKTLKNPSARLAVNLGLFAAALLLMCIGNRWLFFIGLALVVVSGCFSVRPLHRMGWLTWLGLGLLGAAAIGGSLWLSSWGREPFDPVIACVAGFGVAVSEVGYWRSSRNAPVNT